MKGITIWLYGQSGVGKTTIAQKIKVQSLGPLILPFILIDGDDLRAGLCEHLPFTNAGRNTNVKRAAHIAKLLNDQGFHVIVALMTPMSIQREKAQEIIGEHNVFFYGLDADEEVLVKRDVKGLYKRFENGEIENLPGFDMPFELWPANKKVRSFILGTTDQTVEYCADRILRDVREQLMKQP
jgi:adenylylsulfate kinase